MITLLADEFGYRGSRLEHLIGQLSNRRIRTIVEIVVVTLAASTFIANTIYLTDFSIYLFCDHRLADFCFDRISYTLIIFFVVFFIAIIPELHVFGYVNTISIIVMIGTGKLNSLHSINICGTLYIYSRQFRRRQ